MNITKIGIWLKEFFNRSSISIKNVKDIIYIYKYYSKWLRNKSNKFSRHLYKSLRKF